MITLTGEKRKIQELKTVPRTTKPKLIKLSHVIDQNAEQETLPLPKGDEQAAFDHWNDLTGEDPPPDVEPTADQLAALQTVVDEGVRLLRILRYGATGRTATAGVPSYAD